MAQLKVNAMSRAKALMIVRHPFYANILLSTPIVEEVPHKDAPVRKDVGFGATPRAEYTASTDMANIYYNAAFINSLPQDIVVFVLVHEVMHIVLKHGLRRQGRKHVRWNIACDFAINLMLKKSGFTLWEKALCDPQYDGMSAEQIYELREQRLKEQLKQQMENQEPGGSGDGEDPGQGDPQDDGEPGGGGNPDPFGNGSYKPGRRGEGTLDYGQDELEMADVLEAAEGNPELKRKIEREIERKVAQAATMAKMQGKLPADLERVVEGILHPPLRWQDVLRDYMTAKAKDDESWSHRNRRFRNIYLPAHYSEAMGEIVLIGDTSGSITNDELAQIGEEVREIAEVLHPERIRVIWADAAVANEETFEPGEPIVLHPKGGGGTDMRVPLKRAEDYDPIVCLMFTDCCTPWPNETPFPLIVLSSTNIIAPIGTTIALRPPGLQG